MQPDGVMKASVTIVLFHQYLRPPLTLCRISTGLSNEPACRLQYGLVPSTEAMWILSQRQTRESFTHLVVAHFPKVGNLLHLALNEALASEPRVDRHDEDKVHHCQCHRQ